MFRLGSGRAGGACHPARATVIALAAAAPSPYVEAMGLFFAFALIGLPILDIVSLIKAGALLGFWPTLGLVALAVVAGSTIVRHQGLSIGRSVQASLHAGRLPVVEAFNGACVLIAGLLLLFPGLVSDAVALLLLLPPVRGLLRRLVGWRIGVAGATVAWSTNGRDGFPPGAFADPGFSSAPPGGRGPVIDGEYETWEPAAADPAGGARPLPPPQPRRDDPNGR